LPRALGLSPFRSWLTGQRWLVFDPAPLPRLACQPGYRCAAVACLTCVPGADLPAHVQVHPPALGSRGRFRLSPSSALPCPARKRRSGFRPCSTLRLGRRLTYGSHRIQSLRHGFPVPLPGFRPSTAPSVLPSMRLPCSLLGTPLPAGLPGWPLGAFAPRSGFRAFALRPRPDCPRLGNLRIPSACASLLPPALDNLADFSSNLPRPRLVTHG